MLLREEPGLFQGGLGKVSGWVGRGQGLRMQQG